ncbi:FAD-dependent oxidoreductase, partial [Ideonella dechloratans]
MKPDCDLLVLGGGISGAGVALEAARRGLRVTLVEARDYAWGASSRSSKLVHGGLRYLQSGALHLTRESVQEREALLRELPGLVERIGFVMAHRRPFGPGRRTMQIGLRLYDHLAGRRARGWASNADIPWLVPGLATDDGASLYEDATTDDARLTLRVLQEARSLGAELHNHTTLTALQRDGRGQIRGATLRGPDGFERSVACRCIVSASGPWLGTVAALAGAAPPRL